MHVIVANNTLSQSSESRHVLLHPENAEWKDWKWQQRNAITSVEGLLKYFPGLPEDTTSRIRALLQDRKLTVTPYTVKLIKTDEELRPLEDDPVWRQLIPDWRNTQPAQGLVYDGESENWELPNEMVTPICQHKYDNRVILRLSNVCHSYCQFCYEALRTLEKDSAKPAMRKQDWAETLSYIDQHKELDEVILSGGEPLMHSDAHLDGYLRDLRALRPELIIRVHTRALTFNPFRITEQLIDTLERNEVTSVGLHVAHPAEITEEFLAAARRIAKVCPILFANIPFLQGVNDDYQTMVSLCLKLYRHGIQPHYLYHFMPFSPGAQAYRTNISAAVEIVSRMKRRISNIAVPEYVLPHKTGKYTVPLNLGKEAPVLERIGDDEYLSFVNWQGEHCTFPE